VSITKPTEYPTLKDAIRGVIQNDLELGRAMGYRGTNDGRKQFGQFHQDMLDHSNSHSRTSTIVPRGHAKSTVLSVIKNSGRLIRDPQARILVASAGMDLACQLLGEVRDRLSGDLCFNVQGELIYIPVATLFPHARPIKRRGASGPCEQFNIEGRCGMGREPSIFAGSPGTALAGKHPNYATVDDPANEQNSHTFARRQQVIEFIQQLEPLMYAPTSPIDHIGTPWAFSDVTSYLGESPDWHQFRFSVWDGRNADGVVDGKTPLCPSFLTVEDLDGIQRRLSKVNFAAQYLCNPVPSEDALFHDADLRDASTFDQADLPDGKDIMLFDPVATVEGLAGDRNGLVLVRVVPAHAMPGGIPQGMSADQNCFIPHWAAEVAGNLDTAIVRLETGIAQNEWPKLKTIWVEKVAFSGVIAPWMRERGRLGKVQIHPQPIPKTQLNKRLGGFPTAIRKGMLQFPYEFEGRNILFQRLTEFPKSDYDDVPAALALLGTHLERRAQLPNSPTIHKDWTKTPWPSDGFPMGGPGY